MEKEISHLATLAARTNTLRHVERMLESFHRKFLLLFFAVYETLFLHRTTVLSLVPCWCLMCFHKYQR